MHLLEIGACLGVHERVLQISRDVILGLRYETNRLAWRIQDLLRCLGRSTFQYLLILLSLQLLLNSSELLKLVGLGIDESDAIVEASIEGRDPVLSLQWAGIKGLL